jgi:hypothetical protein
MVSLIGRTGKRDSVYPSRIGRRPGTLPASFEHEPPRGKQLLPNLSGASPRFTARSRGQSPRPLRSLRGTHSGRKTRHARLPSPTRSARGTSVRSALRSPPRSGSRAHGFTARFEILAPAGSRCSPAELPLASLVGTLFESRFARTLPVRQQTSVVAVATLVGFRVPALGAACARCRTSSRRRVPVLATVGLDTVPQNGTDREPPCRWPLRLPLSARAAVF